MVVHPAGEDDAVDVVRGRGADVALQGVFADQGRVTGQRVAVAATTAVVAADEFAGLEGDLGGGRGLGLGSGGVDLDRGAGAPGKPPRAPRAGPRQPSIE